MTERTDTRISNKFATIIMLVAFFAVCYAWSLQLNLGSIEKERERLKNENDSLQENTTQLNARISVVQNPWLPDTLVFANIKIPLTGPENWYIRSNLLASLRARLKPEANANLIQVFRRMDYWFPYIERVADSLEFFEDVKWLCVQESWLNPIARSSENAVGICQFMTATANHYGLNVEWPVDERLLPERAIVASIRYVQNNYETFRQDILFALAAYNKGEGGVLRAIEQHEGTDPNFCDIEIQTRRQFETEYFFFWIVSWKLVRKRKNLASGSSDAKVNKKWFRKE